MLTKDELSSALDDVAAGTGSDAGAVSADFPFVDPDEVAVLLFTSVQDHVVPPSASDLLAAHATGPV